jgi:hypothetical protein
LNEAHASNQQTATYKARAKTTTPGETGRCVVNSMKRQVT